MRNRILGILIVSACAACKAPAPHDNAMGRRRAVQPLTFEANAGQIANDYDYLARTATYDAAFRPRGVSFVLKDSAADPGRGIELEFPGARSIRPTGDAPLKGRINYLRGADERAWIRDIPTYERLQYRQLYDGIDLLFYGADRQIEYDFVVAPHADPSRISMKFTGADTIRLDGEGNLVVAAGGRQFRQKRPFAYQERDGSRTPVEVSYVISANRVVTVRLGTYDGTQPLTIDPMIVLSRLLGGSASDVAKDTVVHGGSLYIAGDTCSADFPTVNALQPTRRGVNCDGFVTKLFRSRLTFSRCLFYWLAVTDRVRTPREPPHELGLSIP